MASAEKTVFISYRRTNAFTALAVYQDLSKHGYDVFFDYNSIDSGDFEQVILNNILSRAHFIVILTPSALERCSEPGDWLRREIETALDNKRNIVPLMFEGFSFGDDSISKHLTGKLALLKQYNAQRVPADFFEEAMAKIRSRYLNTTLDVVLHPRNPAAQQAANRAQSQALEEQEVVDSALRAQELYERGHAKWENGDYAGAIEDCTAAIVLEPKYAEAYMRRGAAYARLGNYLQALANYDLAILFKPDYAHAYNNRGNARYNQSDLTGAIADYDQAIRLAPDHAKAYIGRGAAYYKQGNKQRAKVDWETALRYDPSNQMARDNLGIVKRELGE